jgi:triacylglycerol lipase
VPAIVLFPIKKRNAIVGWWRQVACPDFRRKPLGSLGATLPAMICRRWSPDCQTGFDRSLLKAKRGFTMSILVELPEIQYATKVFANFAPSTGFNLATARAMAWMSQLAYETRFPDKIERIASGWDLRDVRVLQQPARSTLPLTSTHGVMATIKDAMIVAFAGTDPLNLLNWISDFYVGRVEADVHQGFEDAADAVWTDVGAAIERNMNDGRALFIAGHSLGAAIALIIADRAHREKALRQGQIYVFGSPRVGRDDFVGRYNAVFGPTTYRFVHGRDIVATVPPSELGFHHVGRLLQCDSGQKFDQTRLRNDEGSDDPQAGDAFFSGIAAQLRGLSSGPLSLSVRNDPLGILSQLLSPSIGDHLPDRYYTALMPMQSGRPGT